MDSKQAGKKAATKEDLMAALEKLKGENQRDIAAIHRSVKEFKEGVGMEMAELRKIVEAQSRALGQIGRVRPVPPKADPN